MGTHRSIDDLKLAGLVKAADLAALEPVAARYAIGITPDLVRLIDRTDPVRAPEKPHARDQTWEGTRV